MYCEREVTAHLLFVPLLLWAEDALCSLEGKQDNLHLLSRMCLPLLSRMCLHSLSRMCLPLLSRMCLHSLSRMCLHFLSRMCLHFLSRMCLHFLSRMCLHLLSRMCLHFIPRHLVIMSYQGIYFSLSFCFSNVLYSCSDNFVK